jgi:hypothetical protein
MQSLRGVSSVFKEKEEEEEEEEEERGRGKDADSNATRKRGNEDTPQREGAPEQASKFRALRSRETNS